MLETNTKAVILRAAYLAASAATVVIGWFGVSGGVIEEITRRGRPIPTGPLFVAFTYFPAIIALGGICLFVFLTRKPHWWGKLICLYAALSWIGFGIMSQSMHGYHTKPMFVLGAGLAMLLVTITLQIADPRFRGPYLRAI